MRRGKLSNISVKIVIIAGFFSLLSIFLDQLVIQKEDSLRINELKIDKSSYIRNFIYSLFHMFVFCFIVCA